MATRRLPQVVHILKAPRVGLPVFVDIRLPGGLTVRQVDQTVHTAALANAARILRKRIEP